MKIRVDQPNFDVKVQARGVEEPDRAFTSSVSMDAGPTLRVAITYENTGSTQQDDVVVRAQVPVGLQGVGGTTWIRDSANPDGLHVNGDVFSEDGINIDTRDPGDVVHVWFDAIVTDPTLGDSPELWVAVDDFAAVATNAGTKYGSLTLVRSD